MLPTMKNEKTKMFAFYSNDFLCFAVICLAFASLKQRKLRQSKSHEQSREVMDLSFYWINVFDIRKFGEDLDLR